VIDRSGNRRAGIPVLLLAVFSWVGAPLLSLGHGHAHRYCEDHRAFEEAVSESFPSDTKEVPSDGSFSSAVDVRISNEGAHVVCAPAVWTRTAFTVLERWTEPDLSLDQTGIAEISHDPGHQSIPLLLDAPKGSPPA
jgi:hypothetical protein